MQCFKIMIYNTSLSKKKCYTGPTFCYSCSTFCYVHVPKFQLTFSYREPERTYQLKQTDTEDEMYMMFHATS